MTPLLPAVLFLVSNIDTSRGDPPGNPQVDLHADPNGVSQDVPTSTKASSRLYDPNFGHEPYWPGGDWIVGVDMPTTLSTASPILICGDECPENYRGLGPVCVMSMHWSHYENKYETCPSNYALKYFHTRWDGNEHMYGGPLYQKLRCAGKIPYTDDYYQSYWTINSYCEYLAQQCLEIPESHKHWTIFVHLGQCMEVGFAAADDVPYLGDTWKELFQTHFNWGRHEKRADFWVAGVRERLGLLKQTPFAPHRWPVTTPSSDDSNDTLLGPLGPPGAAYGGLGADTNETLRPAGGPPRPPGAPGAPGGPPSLREGGSQQEQESLSEVIESWQDYLRILR